MAKPRMPRDFRTVPPNQRRGRVSLAAMLGNARHVADEMTNRPARKRGARTVRAAIAATAADMECDQPAPLGLWRMFFRNLWGLPLLPLSWITLWTLLWQFQGAMNGGFWRSMEFWNFAIGVLVMLGWFCSRIGERFLLWIYVVGHELTHCFFVILCGGRVTGFKADCRGGYVTTTKSNWLIALSPYFFPLWSAAVVAVYLLMKWLFWQFPGWGGLSPQAPRVFYLALGLTWTFNLVWTLWMIPRDQPDLRDNGTLLSLSLIFLGNLVLLTVLHCLTGPRGLVAESAAFARDWFGNALALWQHGERLLRLAMDHTVRAG